MNKFFFFFPRAKCAWKTNGSESKVRGFARYTVARASNYVPGSLSKSCDPSCGLNVTLLISSKYGCLNASAAVILRAGL